MQKEWVGKCKRSDFWNPNTAFICSNHFSFKDFHRDLKNELLGGKHKKILLPGVIPTLNLPCAGRPSISTINQKNKMEAKSLKQVNNYNM